jgi:molybdopterin-guanine dinucleotide biosynthesis protein A
MSHAPKTAAILAGGHARRYAGRDKSRLLVEGRPIIVRQVEVLQRVADPVVVIAPDPERFADLGLPVHGDRIPDAGAMGGVYTALEVAETDLVVIVACDLPFLDAMLLDRLAELASDGDAAWVRTPDGVEPLLACYRRRARQPIREAIDADRLKLADLDTVLRIAELEGEALAGFGVVERLVANLNTPDDHARIQ